MSIFAANNSKTDKRFFMKKKLLEQLTAKCKDMGLSETALQQIADLAANGLADDATEEAIAERVNQYEPLAKAMQAEATRWAQKKQPTPPAPVPPTPPTPKPNEDEPWAAAIKSLEEKYAGTLKTQSETITKLQQQLTDTERTNAITAAMKKLGLTDADMEYVTVPADANVEEYLGKYKQNLVSRGLKPEASNVTQEAKSKAENDMADEMVKKYCV